MRRKVTITNPDKPYFPSGFRKVDLIRYYAAIARWMLPHLKDRPVTLIRYPEGVRGEKFYEKNAPGHAPDWIKTFPVPRTRSGGVINYILINNVETLAWCANLGSIEFHPFLHKAPRIGRPTHLAFDLDPGEGADLLTCIEVAGLLREVFGQLGLEAWPKVSGSKGLQLYVPLNVPLTYDATTPFAKSVAELLAQRHPKLVVSDMAKVLRKKRVLIDWSQNVEAKTTVCVYAVRGKHDEPFVSCPVTWEELDRAAKRRDKESLFFSPDEAVARAKKVGDLFEPVLTRKQRLPEAFMELSKGASGASTRVARGRPAPGRPAPGRPAPVEVDSLSLRRGSDAGGPPSLSELRRGSSSAKLRRKVGRAGSSARGSRRSGQTGGSLRHPMRGSRRSGQKADVDGGKSMVDGGGRTEGRAKARGGRNMGRETHATSGNLAEYARKRDFGKTSEPEVGRSGARALRLQGETPRRFVIQKHAASHLHFDFRLEMGGTLKSWAVPKGLPYELGVKRSAFQVEDHPIEYLDFEGTIPKGQYGGGTVMVWDIGTYEVIGGNYYRGDLKLWLSGKKLKGEWHIFRIKSDEGKPVWLVTKSGQPMKPLSAKKEDESVLSGRSMHQIGEQNTRVWNSNRDGDQKIGEMGRYGTYGTDGPPWSRGRGTSSRFVLSEAEAKGKDAGGPPSLSELRRGSSSAKLRRKVGRAGPSAHRGRHKGRETHATTKSSRRSRAELTAEEVHSRGARGHARKSDRNGGVPAPKARRGSKRNMGRETHATFVEPMKPRLVEALPEGDEWLYEVKWDGFRASLLKDGEEVRLLSRNNKPLDRDFPGIVDAGRELGVKSCVIDGEIVALDEQGRPTFQALQNRATTDATIVFHAFDLLALDGRDLREEPLERRKEWLEDVVSGSAVRLSRELKGSAAAVVAAAEKLGLEGIVAKRRESAYRSGDRSMDWQKVRLRRGQEFVVGGYRPGMHPFESVLVGYYEGKKLMFAGKVRPGFRPHSRKQLWALIKDDEVAECPFANLPDAERKGRWGEGITPAEMKMLRWVKPRVVVEIGFAEWTSGGHLRHAEFKGIREDKKATQVGRETAG